jgi:hypothetical protein
MAVGQTSLVALGVSAGAALGAAATYLVLSRKLSENSSSLEELEDRVNQVQLVEDLVFDYDDQEDLERSAETIFRDLFSFLKESYGIEASTPSEMIEELQNSDAEDASEIVRLFEVFSRLEYSDRELSNVEKTMLRQTSYAIIRRAGPVLQDLETDTE